ncbi:MAG: stage III sporulation protein AC [Candidatus Borkfalkiaceae bacterium]|nr:stage III sporulation protein AC [Christensenellaceae bacterium]
MSVDVIFKIAAIGILVTVICQILKKSDRDDIATLVALAGLIIVLTFVIAMIGDLFDEIRDIFNLGSAPGRIACSLRYGGL